MRKAPKCWFSAQPQGQSRSGSAWRELARRELNEVHVEAGLQAQRIATSAGLVDELLIYLAPRILGDCARGMFNLPELKALSESTELDLHEVTAIGRDIRVIARARG